MIRGGLSRAIACETTSTSKPSASTTSTSTLVTASACASFHQRERERKKKREKETKLKQKRRKIKWLIKIEEKIFKRYYRKESKDETMQKVIYGFSSNMRFSFSRNDPM